MERVFVCLVYSRNSLICVIKWHQCCFKDSALVFTQTPLLLAKLALATVMITIAVSSDGRIKIMVFHNCDSIC